ncbi:MAG: hypothetical protein WCT04_26995, partial [Planctomycetota bacterium]
TRSLSASNLDVFGTINSDALGSKALGRLDETVYWQYSTCRQGDLRPDGVWLGTVGVSGKDATLKYEIERNYEPDSDAGSTIFMWYKPAWHGTDHREHEFFNATRPGKGYESRQHRLAKHGRFSNTLNSGNGSDDGSSGDKGSDCCLCFTTEGLDAAGTPTDLSWNSYLHGGYWKVPYTLGRNFIRESPSFHVQPFRWGSVGAISKPHASVAKNSSSNPAGWWIGDTSTLRDTFIRDAIRPFVDSQRDPEGSTWVPRYFRKDATATTLTISDLSKSGKSGMSVPQPAAWSWCDGASDVPVFSINNLNGSRDQWIFRSTPSDGTCAVIDEVKLCNKAWDSARIGQEQTKCRYYTPDDPGEKGQCPTFTSQTMFESLKGVQTASVPEMVTLAHVTWSGFTPRFLHENKSTLRRRTEVFKGRLAKNGTFRGPFDYIQYNLDVYKFVAASEGQTNEGEKNLPALLPSISVSPLGVERPSPADYKGFVHKNDVGQPHYARGFQIELLNKDVLIDNKTFDDPEEYNTFGTPTAPVRVKVTDLRYRVRFRYRIDNLVDSATGNSGKKNIDPSQHFTLDTPVFDDISIKFLADRVVYLDSKPVTE